MLQPTNAGTIMTQVPHFSTRIDAPDLNKLLLMLTYMNLNYKYKLYRTIVQLIKII